MNLTDSVENLFVLGAQKLTVGRPPEEGPAFFMEAIQAVPRGERANFIVCNHQVTGNSIAVCLDKITQAMNETHKLTREQPAILPMLRKN